MPMIKKRKKTKKKSSKNMNKNNIPKNQGLNPYTNDNNQLNNKKNSVVNKQNIKINFIGINNTNTSKVKKISRKIKEKERINKDNNNKISNCQKNKLQ